MLKCYKLIFNLNEYKHNYANCILINIFIFLFITFAIFYCRDYHNLKKILNMIVYFKLNSNLVKKFLERNKKEEQMKLEKINKILFAKNDKEKKIGYLNLKDPIILKYLKFIKRNKIYKTQIQRFNLFYATENFFGNPIKKKSKKGNFLNNVLKTSNFNRKFFSSTEEILDKNNKSKNVKNTLVNKNEFPYNMNENQMKYF